MSEKKKRKSPKNNEIEVITNVTHVDINECPPTQAEAMRKVRQMFAGWFAELENETKAERETK